MTDGWSNRQTGLLRCKPQAFGLPWGYLLDLLDLLEEVGANFLWARQRSDI
jgi:hypothetical protein